MKVNDILRKAIKAGNLSLILHTRQRDDFTVMLRNVNGINYLQEDVIYEKAEFDTLTQLLAWQAVNGRKGRMHFFENNKYTCYTGQTLIKEGARPYEPQDYIKTISIAVNP